MESNNLVIENINRPDVLEQMYRKDPKAFAKSFKQAWELNSDSPILHVWNERLNFSEKENPKKSESFQSGFFFMGILAIMAGVCTRIIFHFVEQEAIAPINLAFGVIPFIAAYFVYKHTPKRSVIYSLVAMFLVSGIYLNMLPLNFNDDSIILAYLHFPIFLWVLLGLAYTGNNYLNSRARLAYIKFNLRSEEHTSELQSRENLVCRLLLRFLLSLPTRRSSDLYSLVAMFLVSGIYLNMLPLNFNDDSIILAYLHFPIFLWVLLGLAYTGNNYLNSRARLAYIKFNL